MEALKARRAVNTAALAVGREGSDTFRRNVSQLIDLSDLSKNRVAQALDLGSGSLHDRLHGRVRFGVGEMIAIGYMFGIDTVTLLADDILFAKRPEDGKIVAFRASELGNLSSPWTLSSSVVPLRAAGPKGPREAA